MMGEGERSVRKEGHLLSAVLHTKLSEPACSWAQWLLTFPHRRGLGRVAGPSPEYPHGGGGGDHGFLT